MRVSLGRARDFNIWGCTKFALGWVGNMPRLVNLHVHSRCSENRLVSTFCCSRSYILGRFGVVLGSKVRVASAN